MKNYEDLKLLIKKAVIQNTERKNAPVFISDFSNDVPYHKRPPVMTFRKIVFELARDGELDVYTLVAPSTFKKLSHDEIHDSAGNIRTTAPKLLFRVPTIEEYTDAFADISPKIIKALGLATRAKERAVTANEIVAMMPHKKRPPIAILRGKVLDLVECGSILAFGVVSLREDVKKLSTDEVREARYKVSTQHLVKKWRFSLSQEKDLEFDKMGTLPRIQAPLNYHSTQILLAIQQELLDESLRLTRSAVQKVELLEAQLAASDPFACIFEKS